jgi:phosphoserine phosphatase RsbU/P
MTAGDSAGSGEGTGRQHGARGRAGRVGSFVRDYTGGVSRQEVRRLFERDAAEAWAVLTRDQPMAGQPKGGLGRFLFRTRVFFLGLSYKLTPPRRLLFAAAAVAAVLAMVSSCGVHYDRQHLTVRLDADPLWYLFAVGCLGFLLALELVDRVRVRDELEVARQLQRDLQPSAAPELPQWSFAHVYRTANEVGGDYYDFPLLPDGRVALVIGDASGHGMAAGLLMAIANATLHTALDLDPQPERVAEILNRALYRAGDRRAFMTFFYGLLDPASGRLDYVCAGHPFPLLRRTSGAVEELGCGGLPLGMRPRLDLAAESVIVEPGDLLLLYTDGLPEAVDAADRAFGFERLRALVAGGGGPETVKTRVLAAFDQHRGERALGDDVSLLVLMRQPDTPPPPPPPIPA